MWALFNSNIAFAATIAGVVIALYLIFTSDSDRVRNSGKYFVAGIAAIVLIGFFVPFTQEDNSKAILTAIGELRKQNSELKQWLKHFEDRTATREQLENLRNFIENYRDEVKRVQAQAASGRVSKEVQESLAALTEGLAAIERAEARLTETQDLPLRVAGRWLFPDSANRSAFRLEFLPNGKVTYYNENSMEYGRWHEFSTFSFPFPYQIRFVGDTGATSERGFQLRGSIMTLTHPNSKMKAQSGVKVYPSPLEQDAKVTLRQLIGHWQTTPEACHGKCDFIVDRWQFLEDGRVQFRWFILSGLDVVGDPFVQSRTKPDHESDGTFELLDQDRLRMTRYFYGNETQYWTVKFKGKYLLATEEANHQEHALLRVNDLP